VLPRLAGDCDRRPGAGEHDPVGRDRLSSLERQPPPVALDVEPDDLAVDDLGLGPLGDLAQVSSPLPVRRPHPPAIDPIGVSAVCHQMPLPAELRHRRSDQARRGAPAVWIRKTYVLLGRRPQWQETVRVALPPAPVSGDCASVDEHNLWGIEADRGESTRLRGDRDALRPRAYDRQRRHQTRIVSGRAFSDVVERWGRGNSAPQPSSGCGIARSFELVELVLRDLNGVSAGERLVFAGPVKVAAGRQPVLTLVRISLAVAGGEESTKPIDHCSS
jgi:hypothetical protein